MLVLKCGRCGAEYPGEYQEQWGQNGIGDAYGPQPVCTAHVIDARTGAGAVCRGQLLASDQPERRRAGILKDLQENRRFSRDFTLTDPADGTPTKVSAIPTRTE